MPIPERHSRHGKWVEKIPAYFCGTLVEHGKKYISLTLGVGRGLMGSVIDMGGNEKGG